MDIFSLLSIMLTIIISVAAATFTAWSMHRTTTTELKDFHGRLCTLEEKYMQMMQKYWEGRVK